MKIIRNSGIVISKAIGLNNIKKIKESLTRITPSYQNSPSVTIKFYLENEEAIKVPRYFPIDDFVDFEINDVRKDGDNIDIKHNIVLRDDLQINACNYMKCSRSGIIKAAPGSGKTVITICAICEIGKKALILVHRDSLVDQWIGPGTPEKIQGFLGHTSIDKNDIGRLTSSNFKECLKKSIIIATDQTFISLLKRNRTEFLEALRDSKIGVLISDECHTTTGAPTFSECSIHIPTYRTFGLSATPSRADGTFDIMEYHLGKLWVPEGKATTMDGKVTVVLFNSGVIPKSTRYIYWAGLFQRSRYLKILKNSPIFMNICSQLISKFYDEGRNLLVVGERIKLLEELLNKVNREDSGMFIGSSKLDKIKNRITYTTPGKSRDGVDYVEKDCLIMTSPIGNIDQMTGRTLRVKEEKKTPIIIDMVDIGVPEIKRTFFSRFNFYKSKKWAMQYIHFRENEITKLKEEDVSQILHGDE